MKCFALNVVNNMDKTKKDKPFSVILEADKTYFWCSCGLSKSQPFCDGSHKDTNKLPVKLCFDEETYIKLCGCKKSQNKPYCDGSHLKL